jgi:hypothetical protein
LVRPREFCLVLELHHLQELLVLVSFALQELLEVLKVASQKLGEKTSRRESDSGNGRRGGENQL